MKRRNSIAMQASGYTVSGMFATTSALALVSGKGLSSMFYGALSAITAAATNELASVMETTTETTKPATSTPAQACDPWGWDSVPSPFFMLPLALTGQAMRALPGQRPPGQCCLRTGAHRWSQSLQRHPGHQGNDAAFLLASMR